MRKLGLNPSRPRRRRRRRRRRSPPPTAPRPVPGKDLISLFEAADAERPRADRRVPVHRAPAPVAIVDPGPVAPLGDRRLGEVTREQVLAALAEIRASPAGHHPEPRGHLPGPGEVRPGPDRVGPGRQARPGDRPGRGDPPRHPGAVAPHQEQPGAHRRARRGQDRGGRGPGPAHRRGRRPRLAARQAASSRSTWARWWPAPSTAATSRSASRPCSARSRTPTARSSPSSTRCTPSWAPAPPARARWTRATCSSPCWPAVSCAWSAPPRSTSSASTSRRTPPSSAASSRCSWPSPSVEASIAILRGLKERYEVHHGVRIQDPALVAAAVLSDRYLTGRFLPDKAIDLVDEAASSLRIEIDSVPTEIDVVERRIDGLEIERVALAKETDAASVERLDAARRGAGQPARAGRRHDAPTGSPRRTPIAAIQEIEERLELLRPRPSGPSARATSPGPRRSPTATSRCSSASSTPPTPSWPSCSHDTTMLKARSTRRTSPRSSSRWTGVPGVPPHGGRDGQAAPPRGRAARAGHRPGRGRVRGGQRHPPQPRRPVRPRPAHRQLPVPRPHRRRQDRAGPEPGRLPVRRRAGHGPHRHERVHGEAHGEPADRCASRLRRLRRGRPAHRGRPAPPLRRGPAGRGGEGPPGRVQRPAAAARRRSPDRRPGPHRRLRQRRADHDLQPAG